MSPKIHAERSVTITRVLKAPRDLVWAAWTETRHLKEWWGPEMFTNPVVEGEVKVGSEMHITMHGPKGSQWDMDLPMVKRYVEIVPGKSWCSRTSRWVRAARSCWRGLPPSLLPIIPKAR